MTINGKKIIKVAIAVLDFDEKLLIATRKDNQHQGGKLEFIGGKIESNETPVQALNREVLEEIGLDISTNICIKLGRIFHDYGDKIICLYVYQVPLTQAQYIVYQSKNTGLLGQKLAFYDKSWVLNQGDLFPDANRKILMWLNIPDQIIISHRVMNFATADKWLKIYQEALPFNSLFYIRCKSDNHTTNHLITQLANTRQDVKFIVTLADFLSCRASNTAINMAFIKLTTQETHLLVKNKLSDLPANIPLLLSAHNLEECTLVNHLAKSYPVAGVFVSPVKSTKTHPDMPALGWEGLNRLADILDVPIIALGGLTVDDKKQAWTYNALAVSGIRGFL